MINVLLQLAYFLDAVQLGDDQEKNDTFLDIAGPSRSIDGPDNKLTANVDEHIPETSRHPAVVELMNNFQILRDKVEVY